MIATLTYHSIDGSGSAISIAPDAAEGHLRWLTSGRVTVLPLSELTARPPAAGDAVAVTFDDAFVSARPFIDALLDAGLSPTVFVVTRHVGGTNAWGGREHRGIPTLPVMSWHDLEALAARGASIEAHSRTHPRLTALPPGHLDDELEGSRDDLNVRLGIRSRQFAYPFGDVDDHVAGRAEAFYDFAHTTEMLPLDAAMAAPHRLPRLDAYYFRTPDGLAAFGQTTFVRRLAWIQLRRHLRAIARGR